MRYTCPVLILLLLFAAACREKEADNNNYKYSVASWQGTTTYSGRYDDAILKSRRLIQEAARWSGLPGAQIAVAVDGEICWSENYGFSDLENGIPVKANTIFRIASVSKLFTAAALGKLMEEGKLNLDTLVTHYLPELPKHYSQITVRHLASHQSGIRHYFGADKSEKTEHYTNVKDALGLFVDAPLLFPPGDKFEYSSYNWLLISAIIERISGRPFLQYMQKEIWSQMGLKNTFGQVPKERQKDVTTFYLKNTPQGSWEEAPYQDLSFNWGGAGFSSNANDLVSFGNKLLNSQFLKKVTIDSMFKPQLTNHGDTTGFGIGFMLFSLNDNERLIGHGGFMPTARAYLLLFPDSDIVIAFTSNTAMANFADENLVAIAENFKQQKIDENYFVPNRAFHATWSGLWNMEMEDIEGQYKNANLYFYETANELKGTIMLKDMPPAQIEIVELTASRIRFLAMLPAYTATIELKVDSIPFLGMSYYNKPLTYLLKRELLLNYQQRKMLDPKHIRNIKKLN